MSEEQPEKASDESEETLWRPFDDDYDDWLFDDRDSDVDFDKDGDFKAGYAEGVNDHEEEDAPVDKAEADADGKWRCLEASVCDIDQHAEQFDGTPFVQLFKVVLKFNDFKNKRSTETSIAGNLSGEIVTTQPSHVGLDHLVDLDNPFEISYYRKKDGEAGDAVYLDNDKNKYFHLPLTDDPTNGPPVFHTYILGVQFALRIDGKDIFSEGKPHCSSHDLFSGDKPRSSTLVFRPDPSVRFYRRGRFPVVERLVFGDPVTDRALVCVKYATYDGAWATVEVKMLKEGVRSFHGVILARPCIFYSRVRLLTVPKDDQLRGQVGDTSIIKLTRSVVVVPSYSSLIIGAALYDDEKGGELFCRGRLCFPAKDSGVVKGVITYNGLPTLEVKVEWRWRSSRPEEE